MLFNDLRNAISTKKYSTEGLCVVVNEESGSNQFGTGKVDPEKSREKNAAGKQIRSRSGRKYIQPSDFAVKHDDNEAYYCWPDQRGKGEFKWSNWADWKKIRPLARMRFSMGTANPHVYGLSINPLFEQNDNRGFHAYDLTAQPPLQYLTPEEA